MTVPIAYSELSHAEKVWMCNGCGPKLGIDAVPDFIFAEACNRHDFDYWLGFSEHDRSRADKRFLDNMLKAASSQSSWWSRRWYTFLAWRYYSSVRLFGKSAFSIRDRYASREDLEREMKLDP